MPSMACTDPADASRSPEAESVEPVSSGPDDSAKEDDAPDDSDPLHDEHADSEDERWVVCNLLRGVSVSDKQPEKMNNRDSINSVSCPMCFSILSMQTQPHTRYEGQFRAIFVTNCKTVTSQRLHVKGEPRSSSQVYRPIACATCSTEVGVRDTEGVYHFCNVMY